MTCCQKFDTVEMQLRKEFSKAEVDALASFCIIADTFNVDKNDEEGNRLWIWFIHTENEGSLYKAAYERFEKLT